MKKIINKKLKVVDLFAGIGGLSLGFQQSDFKVVAAFDNWEPAIEVYKENFDDHNIYKLDLSDVEQSVKEISKFNPDVIIGGPPCQDFSHAGKRDETRGRADLTLAFAKIVAEIKPRFFVMENVDQILKSKTLPKAVDILRFAGYGLTKKVLDASFCGVPQKRKRFFMIGELNGKDDVLDFYLNKNLSSTPTTIRKYLGLEFGVEHYYRHPRNYSRRAIYSIDEPSATIRGVNRPIPKGYKIHHKDTAKDLKNVRSLTTSERARIQTFPKEFKFNGTKTAIEQMLGNAVPVNLGKYVADCLSQYVKYGEQESAQRSQIQTQLLIPAMSRT
ncbi:MAG: DNA cytosine methyltransferase [Patescibacteria group bacterium]|nr:DNA cytosine methyltransferase [Patescibacteria group bacterium]